MGTVTRAHQVLIAIAISARNWNPMVNRGNHYHNLSWCRALFFGLRRANEHFAFMGEWFGSREATVGGRRTDELHLKDAMRGNEGESTEVNSKLARV